LAAVALAPVGRVLRGLVRRADQPPRAHNAPHSFKHVAHAAAPPAAHHLRHMERYAPSRLRVNRAMSMRGEADIRSLMPARSAASRAWSLASAHALSRYSSGVSATSSSSPMAPSRLAPPREAVEFPASEITGTPIHNA